MDSEHLTWNDIVSLLDQGLAQYKSLDTEIELTSRERKDFDYVRRIVATVVVAPVRMQPMLVYTNAQLLALRVSENPAADYLRNAYESLLAESSSDVEKE